MFKHKNKCWLCEQLKDNSYKMENTNKTMSLKFLNINNRYFVKAEAEDVLEQDISYCPICGRKLHSRRSLEDKNE